MDNFIDEHKQLVIIDSVYHVFYHLSHCDISFPNVCSYKDIIFIGVQNQGLLNSLSVEKLYNM